jgi:hypothetical protein
MKNSNKKGSGANNSNSSNPSDTTTGVPALAVVQAEREENQNSNPVAERLRKINEAGKLSQKRKTLVDASDRVRQFEEGLNGEHDLITLVNDEGAELEIQKPDAVRELVGVLKSNVSKSLAQVDEELLAVTF